MRFRQEMCSTIVAEFDALREGVFAGGCLTLHWELGSR